MLERLGRACVGLGILWVLMVVGYWLLVGVERPEEWAPYIDKIMTSDIREFLYSLFTFVVTPVGMLMLLRDMFSDPDPLWLTLAGPGVFISVYALLLAAAVPDVGQAILVMADPIVARVYPSMTLGNDSASWLARCGAMLLVLAGVPAVVGVVLGLLGGSRKS
ncbi:MAG TPA: hypothetical protein VIE44_03610 [Methylomirabilota bacterium]|jgi:hypothetical protein